MLLVSDRVRHRGAPTAEQTRARSGGSKNRRCVAGIARDILPSKLSVMVALS
jgi:hypothetical protein